MRVRLRVFGVTLVSLVFDAGPLLEIIEDGDEYACGNEHLISGGPTLYMERDGSPLAANHEEPWYEDRFGFHE